MASNRDNLPAFNSQQALAAARAAQNGGVVRTEITGESLVLTTTQNTVSRCRDLEEIISKIENQEVEDDMTSPNARSRPRPNEQPRPDISGARDRAETSPDISGARDNPIRIPSYDPATGDTISSVNPPNPSEDAINALDTESQAQNFIASNTSDFSDSPFLGLGRTATIINRTDYAVPIANLSRDYGIEKSLVSDHIKNFNGSFYVLDTNSNLKLYSTLTRKLNYVRLHGKVNQFTTYPTLNSSSIESYYFRFGNDLKTKNSQDTSRLKASFINGGSFTGSILGQKKDTFQFQKLIDGNIQLTDSTFSLQLPFENTELLNSLNLVGASIVDIKQNYNFYIKEYERIATVNNTISQENVFPNLYVLNQILEEKDKPNAQQQFLKSLASLDDNVSSTILNQSEKSIFGIKDGIGEYFDLFGLNYQNLNTNTLNKYKNTLNNVIFLFDTTSKLNEISKKKYLFPMSVEISIPTDKTTNITKMLIESDLMDTFINRLCSTYLNANSNVAGVEKFRQQEFVISEKILTQNINPGNQQTQVEESFSSKLKALNTFNLGNFFRYIQIYNINSTDSERIKIGDTLKYGYISQETFASQLRRAIFNSKLNTFARNNYRTYEDILNGKKCYNETVAFRVSKYEVGNNSPIQNYWIPNNPDLDFLKIVDTQIKYNKQYTYKIFAYQFVLSNKIKQTNNSNGTSDTFFRVDVENLPEANLMEIELLTTSRTVSDTPPLSPEILFVPYFGVDNKIGLFLNGRTGEEKLEPINILPTDQNITSLYRRNLNNSVLYKSDDIAKRFEIMKLENKPNSYADFSKGFIKTVDTDINPATIQNASAAAFVDTVEPNKKYYYCFRAVDVHEKLSNPTQIFEVEIVNEKGMIFPIIKNYEFEKPVYSNTKEIRRFIKIKPASQHTFLNREVSQIDNDTTAQQSLRKINLGLSDIGVPWGKTFKMVLTSKQTGKKCEFKFKFRYKTE